MKRASNQEVWDLPVPCNEDHCMVRLVFRKDLQNKMLGNEEISQVTFHSSAQCLHRYKNVILEKKILSEAICILCTHLCISEISEAPYLNE